MPRIKPPPAKPELIPPALEDNQPPTEPVEIELGSPEPVETVVELAPEPQPEPVDDNPLQKALEATQRAEEIARNATRERDEALRATRERDQELAQERSDREEAQYGTILTGIAAEEGALAKAKADYATAAAASDWTAAAEAQDAIASARTQLLELQRGKKDFDVRRERPEARQPEPRQDTRPQDFETKLASIQGIPDNAKAWLRKHPEFVNDPAMNERIGVTHNYLTKSKGIPQFSDAYFDALDSEFGFKAAQPEPEPQPQRRSMPVSAPVSRDVPSPSGQRQASSKITLSAEERDIAHKSITDDTMTNAEKERLYALGKKRMNEMKANGTYGTERQ